jgi:hypothetical protein
MSRSLARLGENPWAGDKQAGGAVEQLAEVDGFLQILDLGLQCSVYETNCVGMDKLGDLLRNEAKQVEVGGSADGFCREGQDADGDTPQ